MAFPRPPGSPPATVSILPTPWTISSPCVAPSLAGMVERLRASDQTFFFVQGEVRKPLQVKRLQ